MKKYIIVVMVAIFALTAAPASAETSQGGISSVHSCHFGYEYLGKPYKECYARIFTIHPGDTVWGIAERFGDPTEWRKLCLYRGHGRKAKIYESREFNVYHIYAGDRVGGCV